MQTTSALKLTLMRAEKSLNPKFRHLRFPDDDTLQFVSFNVQSIKKHLDGINNESIFGASKILLFNETWAVSAENYPIKGFKEVVRNPYCQRKKAQGTIIYVKDTIYDATFNTFHFEVVEGTTHFAQWLIFTI